MKEDRYVRSLANYLCSPVCAVFIYVECELLSGFQGKGREGKGREGEGEGGEENGERRRMGRGGGEVVIYVILFSFGVNIFLILLRNSCGILFFNRFLRILRRKSKLLPIFSYNEITISCIYANSEMI